MGAMFRVLPTARALDPETLPSFQLGMGGIAYYNATPFANALYIEGRNWRDTSTNTTIPSTSPQLNANGYPLYLDPGQILRAAPGQNMGSNPIRNNLLRGRVVLTWEGEGDVRLTNSTLVSGSATGSLVNGRREYTFGGSGLGINTDIYAVNPANPITKIRVWLPDPADPQNKSQEPASGDPEPLFHPTFLARASSGFGTLRFMDWGATNASPQKDWIDRRPPTHAFMTGVINPRSPANQSDGTPYSGDRTTGVAYEHMVALCNAADADMWVCLPHLATDDYVEKLARLILHGSDANGNPYSSVQANPVHAPLESSLRVYIEYSNEIWAGGSGFCQGDYANEQRQILGITKPQFNARRSCQIWKIFQDAFGSTDRLIRVAPAWTGAGGSGENYTRGYLAEAFAYGVGLGAVPDVLAVTMYFGNSIQNFVFENKLYEQLTEENIHIAFDEWVRRILSLQVTSSGQDQTGSGGGFGEKNRIIAQDYSIPLVAYEGGPSIYTSTIVGVTADWKIVDRNDASAVQVGEIHNLGGSGAVTAFVNAMNRHPRMAEVYRLHLNLGRMLGMRTPSAFVDVSGWGKYGQWGHLEYLDQPVETSQPGYSVKWRFLLDWMAEQAALRHIDNPAGFVPAFITPEALPLTYVGDPYSQDIQVTSGTGALSLTYLGGWLVDGVATATLAGNPPSFRVSGTPSSPGVSAFLLRATDSDGDSAWRLFFFNVLPKPYDAVYAEDDFTTSPLPRTLQGNPTGVGFAGSWTVQNNNALNFFVKNPPVPLEHDGLQVSGGGSLAAGGGYLRAGRKLDVSKFDYLVSAQDTTVIGEPGTTVYMSALAHRVQNCAKRMIFHLSNGDNVADMNIARVQFGVLDNGNWGMQVRNAANNGFDAVDSGVSAADYQGKTALLVLAIESSESSDTLRLYVNPTSTTLGVAPPATPAASWTTTGETDIVFRTLGVYGSNAVDQVFIDDIRFGDSWKAVTPRSSAIVPPAAPENLSAEALEQTQIQLTWDDMSDDETGFVIERKEEGGVFAEVGVAAANAVAWIDQGLTPSTTYTYRVKARGAAQDSAYSNEAAATTTAAPLPSGAKTWMFF
jgi:hypothetical protein